MNKAITRACAFSVLLVASIAASADTGATDASPRSIERGRYVVQLGGCNDCHTPGFAQNAGNVPEQAWLVGDTLGWRGGWGTTYASNLRLRLADMSEAQWIDYARTLQARPPMPFWVLNAMSDADLRDVYRFVRALGPAGAKAPAYLPPGQTPAGPFVQFPVPPTLAAH